MRCLAGAPISRQLPDAKSRALQSSYPLSRTSVAGLPSGHFVLLLIGTSIKIRRGALRPGKPVNPLWVGAATGPRGYVGLLLFWIFTLAETRWWHLKQVDDGVPVLRDCCKQRGLSEHRVNGYIYLGNFGTGCATRGANRTLSRRWKQPACAY